jgi:uncharacterized protein (TIGR02145 family)
MGCEKPTNLPLCMDTEGNEYKTVQIGDQIWMAENLRSRYLNDGTPIPENRNMWTLSKPYYCFVNNNTKSREIFYNWHVVNTDKICPIGWHVPNDNEWKELELHIGMNKEQVNTYAWRGIDEASKLKATYSWSWGKNGTDDYGFTAIATGYKYASTGYFERLGEQTEFWATNEDENNIYAMRRSITAYDTRIYRGYTYKNNGCSIRCIKNN